MAKVLLIDDDESVTDIVEDILRKNGFVVDAANNVEDARAMLDGFEYDLIVLDWVMPGMHGIDLLDQLRMRGLGTPVLMLTGMQDSANKVQGLETGADDYLTKPFNKQELLARVRALLRRPKLTTGNELTAGGVTIDTKSLRVMWHGTELKLTNIEYQMLELLLRNKNQVLSAEAIVERAWSSMSESSPDTVRMHVTRLRKKFEGGPVPCPIRTIYGKGYVFMDDEK